MATTALVATVSVMTASRFSGYSLLEAAFTVVVLLVLAAIAVPTFVGSSKMAQEVVLRQDLEQIASEAEARLIRDRGYDYSMWGDSATAVAVLSEENPVLASRLVALSPTNPSVSTAGEIGVGLTTQGHLVLSGVTDDATCVVVVLKPRNGEDLTFSESDGDCPGGLDW